jgi:uncharacterized membrane protein
MERLEKSFEVDAPVHAVYSQWMQFEDFPRFMQGIEEVRRLDGKRLHWRASVAGHEKEWDAEITEDVPDEVIAWRSTSGAPNAGTVRFEPLGADATRVQVSFEYEPENAVEKVGDALGFVSRQVEKSVEDFKRMIDAGKRTNRAQGSD